MNMMFDDMYAANEDINNELLMESNEDFVGFVNKDSNNKHYERNLELDIPNYLFVFDNDDAKDDDEPHRLSNIAIQEFISKVNVLLVYNNSNTH
jgi:hypothetical protein